MATQVFVLEDFGIREEHTAAADLVPNQLIQTLDGLAAVVMSNKTVLNGEKCAVMTQGIIRVPSASGTTLSAGALAALDISAEQAVDATATEADFTIGNARRAKTSGQTYIDCRLNDQEIPVP